MKHKLTHNQPESQGDCRELLWWFCYKIQPVACTPPFVAREPNSVDCGLQKDA